MTLEELKKQCEEVAVFPSGDIYPVDEIPSYMSDDYEIRYQGFCSICDSTIDPVWNEPLADCGCCQQEWYI